MSKHLADRPKRRLAFTNTHRRPPDPAPEIQRDREAARARDDSSTELPTHSAPELRTPSRRNVLLEIEADLRKDAVYQHALAELAGR
ncbi:MAG: hypothetical protein ACXVEU_13005 [Nocardioidaceae bacterium]